MKGAHALLFLLGLVLLFPSPAQAQTISWGSSLTIVNTSATQSATVTVSFYAEDGTVYVPDPLVPSEGLSNPFTLPAGGSQIIVMEFTAASLPNGRYSVIVQAGERVKVLVNLVGEEGTVRYNGSYSGQGDRFVNQQYLPSVNKNFYGWNSHLAIQNLNSAMANIQVDFYAGSSSPIHTVIQSVPAYASWNLDVSAIDALPDGYNGSAIVSAAVPFAAVDNQFNSGAIAGATQTYGSIPQGTNFLYCPGLYDRFYGWFSSLSIQNVGTASATVTIEYSDGFSETNSINPNAAWLVVYGAGSHDPFFSARVSSNQPVVAIANANAGTRSQTYECLNWYATTVNVPLVMKEFVGKFNTAVQIQNVDTADGNFTITYEGYEEYAYSVFVPAGGTHIFYTPGETFLPAGYAGAATVTSARSMSAIVNQVNDHPGSGVNGDLALSYHAVSDWGNAIYAPLVMKGWSGLQGVPLGNH